MWRQRIQEAQGEAADLAEGRIEGPGEAIASLKTDPADASARQLPRPGPASVSAYQCDGRSAEVADLVEEGRWL